MMRKTLKKIVIVFFVFSIILLSVSQSFIHSSDDFLPHKRTAEALRQTFTFGDEKYLAPGTSLVLAFVSLLLPLSVLTIRFLQLVLFLGLVFLTYLVAKKIFSEERIAHRSAILFALSPVIFLQLFSFGNDSLYALFLAAGTLFFLSAIEKYSTKDAILGGLLLGFGALVNPIGLYIPVVFAVLLIIRFAFSSNVKNGDLLFVLLFILSAFSFIILPWFIRNLSVFQGPEPIPIIQKQIETQFFTDKEATRLFAYPFLFQKIVVLKKVLFMFGVPPDLDSLDQGSSVQYKTLLRKLFNADISFSKVEGVVLGTKILIALFHIAIILLALFGIWFARKKWETLLLFGLIAYILFAVIGYASLNEFKDISPLNEFIYPLYFLIYAYAAYGYSRLVHKERKVVEFNESGAKTF